MRTLRGWDIVHRGGGNRLKLVAASECPNSGSDSTSSPLCNTNHSLLGITEDQLNPRCKNANEARYAPVL